MSTAHQATSPGELAHALVAFVDAAKLHLKGCFWKDSKMQNDGCDGIEAAVSIILKQTGSVDLLIPLLQHADPGVRLNASLQLIDDHYDLVIPVLSDLDVNCITEASDLGALVLQMYGEPNTGNGYKKVPPSMTPQPGRRRAG